MRVIVAGKLHFEAGCDCAGVIRDGAAHIRASRAETGCIAYEWAVDGLDAQAINVYEEWASPQDLLGHFRDPSYWAMRDHLLAQPITAVNVNIHAAEGTMPVYTEDGQPRSEIYGVRLD